MKMIRIKVIQYKDGTRRYQPQRRAFGFLWWTPFKKLNFVSDEGMAHTSPIWCDSEEEAVKTADYLLNKRWKSDDPTTVGYRYSFIGPRHGDWPGP